MTESLEAQDVSDEQIASQVLREAVRSVTPSVVRIETTGGQSGSSSIASGSSTTTGLVVSEDGYILSSSFGFAQSPGAILITLDNGSRVVGELVASDESRKLVLLKVETEEPLQVPNWAPRDDLSVGQSVVAVGRVFDPKSPNLSMGILSATHRIWGLAVQCDAKISPNNYGGPLIDWQGRVIGLLVPISPQSNAITAGSEWYDSGIGFAIPLSDWIHRLETMKSGDDLKSGQIGIRLQGSNVYTDPVVVGSRLTGSPAELAGIEVGDLITAVNGEPVRRHTEFMHKVRPLYAGDSIQLSIERGDETLQIELELVGEILPFDQPFVGVLPDRQTFDSDGERLGGIGVRFVYPESAASDAGVKMGDRIVSLNDTPVSSVGDARQILASIQPSSEISFGVSRNGESLLLNADLGRLPESVPDDLPPPQPDTVPLDSPTATVSTIKLPEEAAECLLLEPETYDDSRDFGLLVWIEPPGIAREDNLKKNWAAIAARHDLLVLSPQVAEGQSWNSTDVDFIKNSVESVMQSYTVDPNRIAIGGYQSGGALGMLTGFRERDVFHGTVAIDAPVVSDVFSAEAEPLNRMSVFLLTVPNSRNSNRILAAAETLRSAKFPVIQREVEDAALSEQERARIGRWVDSLDQF